MDPVAQWYIATANVDGQNGRIAFQDSPNLTSMAQTKSAKEAVLHMLSFVLLEQTCSLSEVRSFWRTICRYAVEQQRTTLVMVINPYPTSEALYPDDDLRINHLPGFFVPRVGSSRKWFVEFFIINMPETEQLMTHTFIGRESSELRAWMGSDAYNYVVDFQQEYDIARNYWNCWGR